MHHTSESGWIEVICGPMFAGKTEELIRRVRRLEYAKRNIIVFKPSIDDRYDKSDVVSHDKNRIKSWAVKESSHVRELVEADRKTRNIDAIAFDEIQFLDEKIVGAVEGYATEGMRIIVSGLDMDFRGEPFSFMPQLMARAEFVSKLSAICVRCGSPATRTQRLVNGKPARYDDPIVLIGAAEAYEPRCRHCHEVARI